MFNVPLDRKQVMLEMLLPANLFISIDKTKSNTTETKNNHKMYNKLTTKSTVHTAKCLKNK